MELSQQLALELIRLERQAARVGALLRDAEPELVQMALGAFSPLKPHRQSPGRWRLFWLGWLQESAWRLGLADLSKADSLQGICSTEPDGITRSPWEDRPQVENLGHQSPGDHR